MSKYAIRPLMKLMQMQFRRMRTWRRRKVNKVDDKTEVEECVKMKVGQFTEMEECVKMNIGQFKGRRQENGKKVEKRRVMRKLE